MIFSPTTTQKSSFSACSDRVLSFTHVEQPFNKSPASIRALIFTMISQIDPISVCHDKDKFVFFLGNFRSISCLMHTLPLIFVGVVLKDIGLEQ